MAVATRRAELRMEAVARSWLDLDIGSFLVCFLFFWLGWVG